MSNFPVTVPDQAARDAAINPAKSVLVRAPAGSGKTGVLLLRYLNCLLTVEEPEAVVAITFTRKAAAEIRERILQVLADEGEGSEAYQQQLAGLSRAVRERDQQRGWDLLQNPSRLRISTFDSFCARIARRLPLLSGLGQIKTTDDADGLYREAIFSLFRRLENADPDLQTALGSVLDYASNRLEQLVPLLSNLLGKRDQWGEGIVTGDTQAMEQALRDYIEIEYFELCEQLAAFDFQSLINVVRAQSVDAEALAWAASCADLLPIEVEHLTEHAQLAALVLTSGAKRTLRKRVDKNMGFTPKQAGTQALKTWLAQCQERSDLAGLEETLSRMSELPKPELPERSRALIADISHVLRHLLAELHLEFDASGKLDFPEVAFRAIRALQPLSESAGVYGDALLQEDRIQHILVDEMQDTSVNQIVLLRNLMEGWQPGDGRSLFLCGDLQQSIYLFRGALVGEFERLLDLGHFNGHPLEQLQLSSNFRSAPALVEWVNRAFVSVFGKQYVPAQAQRSNEGLVRVHAFVGDKQAGSMAEAQRLVELVQAAQAEDASASIAILVRSRAHLLNIVPALKAAGLQFAGQDIDKLATAPAVADFLALLRAWWHPADRASWISLLRAPFVGLSWDDCWVIANAAGDELLSERVTDFKKFSDSFREMGMSADGQARLERFRSSWETVAGHLRAVDIRWAVPALWHGLGGHACVDQQDRRNIERVLALLATHADSGYLRDIVEFERALEKLYAQSAPATLEIMTIHKAKGLEFDVVILPGLGRQSRGGDSMLFYWRRMAEQLVIAPRSPRNDEADTDKLYRYLQLMQQSDLDREVDRVLYVALTRAKKSLHLLGTTASDKDDAPRVNSGSLLARLWPQVEHEFTAVEPLAEQNSEAVLLTPLAPRMSDYNLQIQRHWPSPTLPEVTIDRLARQERQAVLEANIEERAIGLVFHELMRRLAGGYRELLEDPSDFRKAVLTRLRHHCHPEQDLMESAAKVMSLCDNTLACTHGQWILKHYARSGAEQAMRRSLGDRWQKLIVDRFFVDGDTCWIIDYKTAQGSGDKFLNDQRERYQEKMLHYKKTIAEATSIKTVRAALYFPASQALVEC
ncbi:MAG: ATP-dependent helicase/nuclease subunit A [Bermanella sp.]|jgi:ATP-dependent helicase/nuclease subunit A